jgi:hypothetical protein
VVVGHLNGFSFVETQYYSTGEMSSSNVGSAIFERKTTQYFVCVYFDQMR